MRYELFYLVGESKEPELETIKESVKKIVVEENCAFLDPQISRKRKMSYGIKGESRGIYIAQRFEVPEKEGDGAEERDEIKNISKKIKLNRNVLRFIIVKAGDLPELKPYEETPPKAAPFVTKKKAEKPAIKKAGDEKKPETDEGIDKKLEEILKI